MLYRSGGRNASADLNLGIMHHVQVKLISSIISIGLAFSLIHILTPSQMTDTQQKPKCNNLVLDAGPLLSLSPLRGLAETYYTTPQVLAELKDSRAREHFEKLGLLSGVKVAVKSPDAVSLSTGK